MKDKKSDKECWEKECKDDGIQEKPSLFNSFNKGGKFRFSIWFFVAIFILITIINTLIPTHSDTVIEYSHFKQKIEAGEIKQVEIREDAYIGIPYTREDIEKMTQSQDASKIGKILRYRTTPVNDSEFIKLLDSRGVEYYAVASKNNTLLNMILSWVMPLGIMLLIWRFVLKRMGSMGPDVLSFGKTKSQIIAVGDTGVRFDDVAGADESKAELVEVVDFLKNPERYLKIGGKIPKGVLLVGAPGTGKTLLARAVAGEAGVPFFRMSGADFVEMFVGVGAARVRDLFRQARQKAPCIIFIDELDAIGKSRAHGISTNDEREQTLNQLLVEMDGFDSRNGVILLAATNRPEILDPALLRPGRFDRQILVDKPDLAGRKAILKIHSKNVKLDDSVDFEKVARSTPGLVGADLANIVNEAALIAVRAGKEEVAQKDFDAAIEKVLTGLEKKNRLINPKEREIVAYHETGHALVAYFTEGSDPVEKISIVPRGMSALGYTLQLPTEERFLMTQAELHSKIDVLLGGRAAEKTIFNEVSTGAANDLTRATDIAKKMITDYGMSDKFQNVYLPFRRGSYLLGDDQYTVSREYSEATQQYIDEETARIINERFNRVSKLLEDKKNTLQKVAKKLLEVEVLNAEDFKALVNVEVKNISD
ncbi:MAG: ATP-dependent zinc metalloprotease FtsH [Spirochaetota bacterium]